ncbi:helix-turn-helix domain-containing protein [Variovorax sp. J22P271]|uniref:helix-turn-helix domain-containing protein n=1 Tax=Variovorax davisae TaxID=3053515 RepID=UPI0025780026|nr:helix-turn-helix domain-containing protein [Variovorax sp. J22P271]MDM0032061.1 helix-turn-helix domain-containing protein [Variovorax sp. J22P271]
MREILTKDEVASLLDCEATTVEEEARRRELPGLKIGRSWVFPREALMMRLNEIALRPPEPSRLQVAQTKRILRRSPPILPEL